MLRQLKPRNARTRRIVEKREPQLVEDAKNTLFLRYTTCSEVTQLVMQDIYALKKPLVQRFTKKNDIHPFEDPSSLEFFSEKNDISLMVYGSHSKKRPHALTLARCFDAKVLDMVELHITPDTLRTTTQFKSRKAAVGLKPLLSFHGSVFDSPLTTKYTVAKGILLDLFKGQDIAQVDVEGLQYIISVSAGEEVEGEVSPQLHLRVYTIKTKSGGSSSLPKVEVEEMGPRIDFNIGRIKEADPDLLKEAMKRPKQLEPKKKKNVETDVIGDKMGRIHVGKQNLANLQTRKMKGLKRDRRLDEDELGLANGSANKLGMENGKKAKSSK